MVFMLCRRVDVECTLISSKKNRLIEANKYSVDLNSLIPDRRVGLVKCLNNGG